MLAGTPEPLPGGTRAQLVQTAATGPADGAGAGSAVRDRLPAGPSAGLPSCAGRGRGQLRQGADHAADGLRRQAAFADDAGWDPPRLRPRPRQRQRCGNPRRQGLLQRAAGRRVALRAGYRADYRPAATTRRLNAARQFVGTVNDCLTAQFGLARHQIHTFRGLRARLRTKLVAHTLCLPLNRLLGRADWFQVKHLAFPN